MNRITRKFKLFALSFDRRHIQLLFLVLTLSLFALGAGAPGSGGGAGCW